MYRGFVAGFLTNHRIPQFSVSLLKISIVLLNNETTTTTANRTTTSQV